MYIKYISILKRYITKYIEVKIGIEKYHGEKKMNEIAQLQNKISILNQEINSLLGEREGLVGFRVENTKALGDIEIQIERRSKMADKFATLKRVSTFANKIAEKISRQYSGSNSGMLVNQYNEIHTNISNAISQVDREIGSKRNEIYQLQNRIHILEEQMRQEQLRQEQLRQEQLSKQTKA